MRIAAAICVLVLAAPALLAQEHAAERSSDFFEKWVAAGKRADIPWRVNVPEPRLGYDQRLHMNIEVELPGDKLARLGEVHELYLLARISDESGKPLEKGGLAHTVERALPSKAVLALRLSFFVTPGEYEIAVVLYDRTLDRFNVHTERRSVDAPKRDPLPGAFSSLPRVELIPAAKGLESIYLPGSRSRLNLPVTSDRAVHFELILLFGEAEQLSHQNVSPFSHFNLALIALHVFSQLQSPDSTLHLTVADAIRRQVLLEQKEARPLDWESLKKASSQINPGVISAGDLEAQNQNASFIHDLIHERLSEPLPRVNGREPLRVLILIAGFTRFPKASTVSGAALDEAAKPLAYRFRFFPVETQRINFARPGPLNAPRRTISFPPDDLDKLIRAIDPVSLDVTLPMDFRSALARILADVAKRGRASSARRSGF